MKQKSKNAQADNTFRITFKTRDGSIVMMREATREYWNGSDKEFEELSLKRDAREHGVRVLSVSKTANGVQCLVEWL